MCLQATCSNRSMLSLSAVRSQSSQLFKWAKNATNAEKNHEYNRDCGKCYQMRELRWPNTWLAHQSGRVKISYLLEKRQQQEEKNRENNQQPSTPYLFSLARLLLVCPSNDGSSSACSHEETGNAHRFVRQKAKSIQSPQSSSVHWRKKIGRSQEVLLGRITQLEEKCNAVHEQQAALR